MPETKLPDYLDHTLQRAAWQRVGSRRRCGILVPLFSVYSSHSQGIGDLHDIGLLADWCVLCGFSIIQFLPMNEVGSLFCPYDAISSFALDPMYLYLRRLPGVEQYPDDEARIQALGEKFSGSRLYVDYSVKDEKRAVLWEIYGRMFGREGASFGRYRVQQEYWVDDFALYKVLKDKNGGAAWYDWSPQYRLRDSQALAGFRRQYEKEIMFEIWLQWMLFEQFSLMRAYSTERGVLLKGDLPILVSRDSADVWAHPEFFRLDVAAGAPPDMYCSRGQRWGMPTYNWDAIAADGFRYLKEKLRYAGALYDILRVDHAVGLFRIWSIPFAEPMENQGMHGFFDPPEESRWGDHGRQLLRVMIENSPMLLCAEDLGMIPDVCRRVLAEYGIPGNDVQRWTKDWNLRHDFLPPREFRRLSVAMLSTHDTTNWNAWWQYEAGTVDEALFMRRCMARGLDYGRLRAELFDSARSKNGRLRWRGEISSLDKFLLILGKSRDDAWEFADMYENSYLEKEKLWKHFGFSGAPEEESCHDILKHAFRITMMSRSLFAVESAVDIALLARLYPGDPWQYRINTPGEVGRHNWALRLPASIEDMSGHGVTGELRRLIAQSGRLCE